MQVVCEWLSKMRGCSKPWKTIGGSTKICPNTSHIYKWLQYHRSESDWPILLVPFRWTTNSDSTHMFFFCWRRLKQPHRISSRYLSRCMEFHPTEIGNWKEHEIFAGIHWVRWSIENDTFFELEMLTHLFFDMILYFVVFGYEVLILYHK